jgi:hypothetical protein
MACQHRGCNCDETPVTSGARTYCSERCAEVETTGKHEESCPCGHAECRAAPPTAGT